MSRSNMASSGRGEFHEELQTFLALPAMRPGQPPPSPRPLWLPASAAWHGAGPGVLFRTAAGLRPGPPRRFLRSVRSKRVGDLLTGRPASSLSTVTSSSTGKRRPSLSTCSLSNTSWEDEFSLLTISTASAALSSGEEGRISMPAISSGAYPAQPRERRVRRQDAVVCASTMTSPSSNFRRIRSTGAAAPPPGARGVTSTI
jgi:hypothetical protein